MMAVMGATAEATIDPLAADVAWIEKTDRDVRAMAKKAGVPEWCMESAIRAFARELIPHAGRSVRTHSLSHWKPWFRGYAAGLRAIGGER
jgi:hypothetical protein